ncbi:PREDICTED: serum response factor-binding protein 1 [Chrysochloris asiatica]|uniref:Serum response factor-binding protein 1 n=1 Tax=Chrysochloris asiatica TaxID=185453 RepID=A0A9B0TX48_CHRAS|nr:PREDICTED: serum response factor-binding protein 1 [Chrysochloris asiatica]
MRITVPFLLDFCYDFEDKFLQTSGPALNSFECQILVVGCDWEPLNWFRLASILQRILEAPPGEFWAEEATVERRVDAAAVLQTPFACRQKRRVDSADLVSGPTMSQLETLNLNNENYFTYMLNDVISCGKNGSFHITGVQIIFTPLVYVVAEVQSSKRTSSQVTPLLKTCLFWGTEDALLKNQRRAQRLLEEIHAMKELKPDVVTKSALGDDINFEKVCKKPDSTATERAVARLAIHPLLKKKIDMLKAGVKAFKDARQNVAEVKSSNTSEENNSKDTMFSNDERKLQHKGTIISGQKEKEVKILAKKPLNNSKEKLGNVEHGPKAVNIPNSPSKPSKNNSVVSSPHQKIPADPTMKTLSQTKKGEGSNSSFSGNSDGEEMLEEEKEYFDDSTEERFYKQSSMSEDSDSDDDFFIGKVRRTRKKESSSHSSTAEPKKPKTLLSEEEILKTHCDIKDDKNKPSTESRKFESVFFHSLSGSKSFRRSSKEPATTNKAPDLQQSEHQIKNQFNKSKQRRFDNAKPQLQLPLHPSWEASRRQKEQQSKIAVFQGKKITFDD